jgi:aspartyl-tRNA(Asn)/glutamyl-tRNA(Gln) amidotransferase subunit A
MWTIRDHIAAFRDHGADALTSVLMAIQRDKGLNAFTRVLADQAMADARALELRVQTGGIPGPLAGVPFAVKDLFDVAGRTTTAGAQMRLDEPAAMRDAEAVARLKRADAILVGTLNMDEYAYGFATVNAHFGTTHNPHDPERLAGGSSGGSAAAVAAGLVPLSLGSDTNGSIRVPASLCGVWGMRPAMGGLPLDGVFPFVHELDTIGPFTRTIGDLKRVYEVLAHVHLEAFEGPVRAARLGGFFEQGASPEAISAVDTVMAALQSDDRLVLPEAEAARSAAFLITANHGGKLHRNTLRDRAMEYDPAVRDRLLAGLLLPEETVVKALDFAGVWRTKVAGALSRYDLLIAPSTPVTAPRIDEGTIIMDGKPVSARANLGIYAQSIGLAGPVVVSAPVVRNGLPIGVQVIAAPGREVMLFATLQKLEDQGVLGAAPVPKGLAA